LFGSFKIGKILGTPARYKSWMTSVFPKTRVNLSTELLSTDVLAGTGDSISVVDENSVPSAAGTVYPHDGKIVSPEHTVTTSNPERLFIS
jgi:hypothetical protein